MVVGGPSPPSLLGVEGNETKAVGGRILAEELSEFQECGNTGGIVYGTHTAGDGVIMGADKKKVFKIGRAGGCGHHIGPIRSHPIRERVNMGILKSKGGETVEDIVP
jgi:hypothetical protein